jgi:hypothetical protein
MVRPRETWNRLNTILDDVVGALNLYGTPVSSQTIEIGEPTWDYCCDFGHAYIRIIRINAVNPFPQQTLEVRPCPSDMGALIGVGVLRCASTLDINGNPPTPEVITDEAELNTSDMSIVYSVLVNHNPDWANNLVVLDTWNPLTPEGGCSGGEWQAWIDIAICPPLTSPTS